MLCSITFALPSTLWSNCVGDRILIPLLVPFFWKPSLIIALRYRVGIRQQSRLVVSFSETVLSFRKPSICCSLCARVLARDWPLGGLKFFPVGCSLMGQLCLPFLFFFFLLTSLCHGNNLSLDSVVCLSNKHLSQWPCERIQSPRSPT